MKRLLLAAAAAAVVVTGCSSSTSTTSAPTFTTASTVAPTTVTSSTSTPTSITPTAALVSTSCGFTAPGLEEGNDLRCATVTRGKVTSFVTIVGGAPTASDPIVHLPGGPGASAEAYAPILADTYLDLAKRTERQVVFIDQRGTGRSAPFLDCPDPSDAAACDTAAAAAGLELTEVTTTAAADDVAGVIAALGVPTANIWGASYGSRLALEVVRRHPEVVRSLLIESVDTADTPLRAVAGVRGALTRIGERCSLAPACVALGVTLPADVDTIAARLTTTPLPIGPGSLDGAAFLDVTTSLMESSSGTSLVPLWLHAVNTNDVATMEAIGVKLAAEPTPGGRFSVVMNILTNCSDIAPFDPATRVAGLTTAAASSPLDRHVVDGIDGQLVAGCAGHTFATDGPTEPVTSDVPALAFAGSDDSNTPLENAQLAAATLSRSTVVAFPGFGHFPMHRGGNPCAASIYAAFVADPGSRLDTSCVAPGDVATTIDAVK